MGFCSSSLYLGVFLISAKHSCRTLFSPSRFELHYHQNGTRQLYLMYVSVSVCTRKIYFQIQQNSLFSHYFCHKPPVQRLLWIVCWMMFRIDCQNSTPWAQYSISFFSFTLWFNGFSICCFLSSIRCPFFPLFFFLSLYFSLRVVLSSTLNFSLGHWM